MMNIQLGKFYNVTGVAVGKECLSILTEKGCEYLIPIFPKYNRNKGTFDPIVISGEFGDFSKAKWGTRLEGLEPRDITKISVRVDYTDDDFHTQELCLTNYQGHNLTWELFCNGTA